MITLLPGSKLEQLGDANVEINQLTCLGNLWGPDMGKGKIRNEVPEGFFMPEYSVRFSKFCERN